MAPSERQTGEKLPSPLVDVIRTPSEGKHRLPYLLSLFDDDDPRVRIAASAALCLVVEEYPEMVDYAVRRLVDRLDDDTCTEVLHTLDYFAAESPHEVDDVLVELEEEAEVRARERMYRTGGGYARSDYLSRTEPGHGGRARVAQRGGSESSVEAYTRDEDEEVDRSGTGGATEDDEEAPEGAASEATANGAGEAISEDIADGTLTRERVMALNERLSQILQNSSFDDLDVLAARKERRYADVYRTLGAVEGEERAIAVNVFHTPGGETGRFVDEFREQFASWLDVHDHENVQTIYDWGQHPQPWAALEYVGIRLSDRDDVPYPEALWNAQRLANALSYAHQKGVVHGGIDPQNVAYVGNVIDDDERQPPLLTNVGLLTLLRFYGDPSDYLDPRYAAPEYYDDRFGRVDHQTDVYQLGMTLYRLFTGRPPYTGEFVSIREQVLSGTLKPPSEVNPDLPPAIDQIVTKATAAQKMARYETVDHLEQELCALDTGSTSNGDES